MNTRYEVHHETSDRSNEPRLDCFEIVDVENPRYPVAERLTRPVADRLASMLNDSASHPPSDVVKTISP